MYPNMASTQKALVVSEVGKPLVLVNDHPVVRPGPNQLLLKVSVAGINPHDQKARDTGLFVSGNLPSVLTNDVVGKVAEIGPNVTDFKVGDRVVSQAIFPLGWERSSLQNRVVPQALFPLGGVQNGLQEYAIADLGALTKIPDSITDDDAATLSTNIITSVVALFWSLRIPAPWSAEAANFDYANTAILIVGGGSNCGKFGVQLAGLAGIGTIVVVGGNDSELKSFGATHIIDRHAGYNAILDHIRDVVGDGLIYAYDAVNPPDGQLLAANALSSKKKGILARLLPLGPVDESKVHGKEAGFELRDVYGCSQLHPDLAKGFWEQLSGFLESGSVKPLGYIVKRGLDASQVNKVLDDYRDGKPVTRTHIHI